MNKHRNIFPGFTMLELMVGIFITLSAIGTFYKLYTNSLKTNRNLAVRSSVTLLGSQMIETISNSIRLLGLNADYTDYDPGAGVNGTIIVDSDGSSGTDSASFRFFSPYGGPITKLSADAGGSDGACNFSILNSSALDADITRVNLISRNGVYEGTVPSGGISNNTIDISSTDPVFAGPCADVFPAGTLLTGPNNDFHLTYINGGANTHLKLIRTLPDGSVETQIDFSSLKNPAYQMPYFVLEFLREYDDAGVVKREWFSEIDESGSPDELKQIKAVRVGFVLLSDVDRVKKKVAAADGGVSMSYCPFDNMCYTLTDLNKTAYVFRKTIHIRNFDYLGINSGIMY